MADTPKIKIVEPEIKPELLVGTLLALSQMPPADLRSLAKFLNVIADGLERTKKK